MGKATLIAELVICAMLLLYIFLPALVLMNTVAEARNLFYFAHQGYFVPFSEKDFIENALKGVSFNDFNVLYFMVLFLLCMYSQSARGVFDKNIIFNSAMMAWAAAYFFVQHSDYALAIKNTFIAPFNEWLAMFILFFWIGFRYGYLTKFMGCFVNKEATRLSINEKEFILDATSLASIVAVCMWYIE